MSAIAIIFYIGIITTFAVAWLASILNPKSFDLWFYTLLLFLMGGVTLIIKTILDYPYDIYHYPLQDLIMAFVAAVIWHEKKQLWAVPLLFLFSLQAGITLFFISLISDEFLNSFKVVYNIMFGCELAVITAASLVYIFKRFTKPHVQVGV